MRSHLIFRKIIGKDGSKQKNFIKFVSNCEKDQSKEMPLRQTDGRDELIYPPRIHAPLSMWWRAKQNANYPHYWNGRRKRGGAEFELSSLTFLYLRRSRQIKGRSVLFLFFLMVGGDHFSFYHEQFFRGVFKSCQIFYPSKVISPKVCSTHLWKHLCWCHLERWAEHTSLLLATSTLDPCQQIKAL